MVCNDIFVVADLLVGISFQPFKLFEQGKLVSTVWTDSWRLVPLPLA